MKGKKTVKKSDFLEIFMFVEEPKGDRAEFVKKIVERVPYFEDIGYAGYSDKKFLADFLSWSIYGRNEYSGWKSADPERIKEEISSALNSCRGIIKSEKVRIFVFPTADEFVVKRMNGISGFTSWKNTIIVGIYGVPGWEASLKSTVCHELAHAIGLNFNDRKTILDDLICEGLAEHFREDVLGKEKSDWVKAIGESDGKKILRKIKSKICEKNDDLFAELFFGIGKFPLWSGYSIGYYIVGDYLKTLKTINWRKILSIPSEKIAENSDFFNRT